MQIENWDREEIKRLAKMSGRPLEVRCAEIFIRAKWKVRLGTFYTDVASEKVRELDFLAERDFPFQSKNGPTTVYWNFRIRILGSCKGFAPDQGPATYSVSSYSQSIEKPCFICYEDGFYGHFGTSFAEAMRRRSVENFLNQSGLLSARQVIGFDILQCKEDQKKVEYTRKTDRDLYEGLDCAIKAAVFWQREDRRLNNPVFGGGNCAYITLNIPLLVSSLAFWDVAIDQGSAGEPELKSSGFHVSLFPSGESENALMPITSILWEAAKLEDLTRNLDVLMNYFMDEMLIFLQKTSS
jgi:hypothetical protein